MNVARLHIKVKDIENDVSFIQNELQTLKSDIQDELNSLKLKWIS